MRSGWCSHRWVRVGNEVGLVYPPCALSHWLVMAEHIAWVPPTWGKWICRAWGGQVGGQPNSPHWEGDGGIHLFDKESGESRFYPDGGDG